MPVLIVGTQVFQYPDPGTEPGWGQDATGWAVAITAAINALFSPGDITPTSITIQDNVSVAEDIPGLFFNSTLVRAANIDYAIYRVSTSTTPGIAESGVILLDLNDTAPVGYKWTMMQTRDGNAGVAFSVTDGGQIRYISTEIGLTGYSGVIDFSAKVLSK